VAVKIRLKRMGKIHAPFYRVVVMDSRTKRDGRAIEEIGKYHPTHEPSVIEIDSERVQYWLGVGAQPTEQVAVLLKITGDWQKYKGLPGTEGTLRVGEPKADKKALFEVASKAAMSEPKSGATTARKSKVEKAEKAAEPKAEKADKAAEPKVEKADKAAEPKVEKADKAAEPKVEKADKAAEPKVEKADKAAEPKVEKAEVKVEKAESPAADAPVVEAPVAEVAAASDEAKAEA
jgi:small subunit ribosomal protein S16